MKIYNIILSLYILALLCLPCGDNAREHDHYASYEFAAGHCTETHPVDLCSSLCSCTCCSPSGLDSYLYSVVLSVNKIPLKNFVVYDHRFHRSAVTAFWQPPRIC